jgi:hypothetical protein
MKTFARILDGRVAELLGTADDIRGLFHPSLVWVEVPEGQEVHENWTYDGTGFTPPMPEPAVSSAPSTAELRAQLAALSAQIASLEKPA